jgi:hypothetical protein
MAYTLRALIVFMIASIIFTALIALKVVTVPFSHIQVAIPAFICTLFIQTFVMFYFIGVARFAVNIYNTVSGDVSLSDIFETPPEDFGPYLVQTKKFVDDAERCKRQTVPWTILMLILGMIAFLLGGAHDTGLVEKTTHSGVVLGFFIAMSIGFFRQWYYLGKSHILVKKLKALYDIPDGGIYGMQF